MSNQKKRPPRDITAEGFFTDWLPREFASEFGAGKRSAADITVAVKLEGEGGGQWVLDVKDGKISLRAGGQEGPTPSVSLRQTVADWRALAVGEEGPVDLAPPQASPLDVLFVDPSSRQIMSAVKGTVRFEVTGYNGRTWWMHVKFGAGNGNLEWWLTKEAPGGWVKFTGRSNSGDDKASFVQELIAKGTGAKSELGVIK